MKKIALVLCLLSSFPVFAQSQYFEGFGVAFDYSLNVITDNSSPGGSATSRSGIPSVTVDYQKAVGFNYLIGAYGTYDLATTDTAGTDPDAHNPFEVGGKIGYAFSNNFMAYAKVGYAWSKYSSPGYYQWMRGPAYGIGVQYMLTQNLFAKAEISQQNYRTVTWNDGSSDKVNINGYALSIGWKFD